MVMDAGIATKDNLCLLIGEGYDYIIVSRQKVTLPKEELLEFLVTVKEDQRNKVETKLYIDGDEAILFCKSKMKAAKELSMRKLFE